MTFLPYNDSKNGSHFFLAPIIFGKPLINCFNNIIYLQNLTIIGKWSEMPPR